MTEAQRGNSISLHQSYSDTSILFQSISLFTNGTTRVILCKSDITESIVRQVNATNTYKWKPYEKFTPEPMRYETFQVKVSSSKREYSAHFQWKLQKAYFRWYSSSHKRDWYSKLEALTKTTDRRPRQRIDELHLRLT